MNIFNKITKYILIAFLAFSVTNYGYTKPKEKKPSAIEKTKAFTKFWYQKIKSEYPITTVSVVLLSVTGIIYYKFSQAENNKLSLARSCIPDYDTRAKNLISLARSRKRSLNRSLPRRSGYEWQVYIDWDKFYQLYCTLPDMLPKLEEAHKKSANLSLLTFLAGTFSLGATCIALLEEIIIGFRKPYMLPEKNIRKLIPQIHTQKENNILEKTC